MTDAMLKRKFVSDAGDSFKKVCLHLLEMAYCECKVRGMIDKDWTENAISEALKKSINDSEESVRMHITAEVEERQLLVSLSEMPSHVDDAPRIDLKFGGYTFASNDSRISCYMEAKNLYSNDFKKTGLPSTVSSTYYAKRYISTGIDHLLSGYYPEDTMLLGYVLVGTVQTSVDKVNQYLLNFSRCSESISLETRPEYTALIFGVSSHPGGKKLEHIYLQF